MGITTLAPIPSLKPITDKLHEIALAPPLDKIERTTLFFSFDIVNSTRYKTAHQGRWADAISEILRHIISAFSNDPAGNFRFWKTLGDEIIFTKDIRNLSDVQDTLEEIYARLASLNQKIKDGIICDVTSGQMLGIKGAAWIADISDSCEFADNIYTEYQINDNRKQPEYVGPNIDAGFRMAHYSADNRLLISYEIAYILSTRNIKNVVKLVTYRSLKGIWNGKLYPILLYRGNDVALQNSSPIYPPVGDEETIQAYFSDVNPWDLDTPPGYTNCTQETLDSIAREIGLEDKLNRLISLIYKEKSTTYHRVKQNYFP